MLSVITDISNKKTKGIVHSHRKIEVFWQLEMFDVCTTGDTAQTDTIFKFLPHTRVNTGASIFFTAAVIRAFRSARSCGSGGTYTAHTKKIVAPLLTQVCQEIEYRIDVYRVIRGAHIEYL
jgi:hypothetical protein